MSLLINVLAVSQNYKYSRQVTMGGHYETILTLMADQQCMPTGLQYSAFKPPAGYVAQLQNPLTRTRMTEYQTLAAPIPVAPMFASCKFNQVGLEASVNNKWQCFTPLQVPNLKNE